MQNANMIVILLHVAVKSGHLEIVTFFLQNGAGNSIFFYFQFEGDEKAMCDKLMQKAGLICRIVNSTYKVDMDKFEKLCQETYVLALETFPFCNVVDSLHRSWGHISKKMRKMGNKGLVRD